MATARRQTMVRVQLQRMRELQAIADAASELVGKRGHASVASALQALSRQSLEELAEAHIERVLKQTGGNKTEAAKILGVDRRTLIRREQRT